MVRYRDALAAMFVLALLAGCSLAGAGQEARPAGSASSGTLDAAQTALGPAGPTLGGQRAGDVLVWLASKPERPARGEASIDVYVAQLDGQPIDNAKLTLDTDMTNMSHGQYLVAAVPAGNGHYIGQVHFSMPGPWRVITVLERPGQAALNLRFEFNVTAE